MLVCIAPHLNDLFPLFEGSFSALACHLVSGFIAAWWAVTFGIALGSLVILADRLVSSDSALKDCICCGSTEYTKEERGREDELPSFA